MSIFRPDEECITIAEINLKQLKEQGFRGVMLDIDNTIVANNTLMIFQEDHLWIRRLQELGLKLVLITYNFKSVLADYIAQDLHCPIIKVRGPYLHRNTVSQAAKIMGIKPEEIVGINDFRIALAALKLFGCRKTILVRPISLEAEKDSRMLRFLRFVENRIIIPLLEKQP